MSHDTLNNRSIKIPDLHIRNPHAWYPPDIDNFHVDPLLDSIQGEEQRERWSAEESEPNYFSEAIDEEDAHYGTKLGSLAVGLDTLIDDDDTDEGVHQEHLEDDHDE